MSNIHPVKFTHSHVVMDDGTVTFKCSADAETWPWLALAPHHPIVIQSMNYFVSVETGDARGTLDVTKWSALTHMDWVCGRRFSGHATHGVAGPSGSDETPRYQLTLFDADGELVTHMTGTGVVFRNRDFKAWRQETKATLAPQPDEGNFVFASAESVGVATPDEVFIGAPDPEPSSPVSALIRKEKGFLPVHPYHGGSGDHVNSNQLADACHQYLALRVDDTPLAVTGGEMEFRRYIELDRPFSIHEDTASDTEIGMRIEQMEKTCARVRLRYAAQAR